MAMALETALLLLSSFLLFTATIAAKDEELATEAIAVKPPVSSPAPAAAPVKAPYPPPPAPVKPTPPPTPVTTPSTPPPPAPYTAPTPPSSAPRPIVRSKQDCFPLCGNRCRLHSRKNLCVRVCVTCCDRCRCVPPGTYGNKEVCGKCYTDMVTRGGKSKCP